MEVRPLRQMTGGSEFDEVFLTDVELPADALLGPLHGGWGVGMAVLTSERGHIGASVIGLERRLAALAAVGSPTGADSMDRSTRDRLAALLTRGHAVGALGRRQGPEASVAGSLMKLGITELLYDSAMLRGDTGRRGRAARRPRRRRHARGPRRSHRGRHQPGPADDHRRAHPRAAPRASRTVVSGAE